MPPQYYHKLMFPSENLLLDANFMILLEYDEHETNLCHI